MLTLFIEAHHGDCGGSVSEVEATSDVKLTNDLPDLKTLSLKKRFITTESWAHIDMEYNWHDYRLEDDEDYKPNEDYKPDEYLGLVFTSDFGDSDFARASYVSLTNNLLELVKQNVYKEVISHNGDETSTVYVYKLDHKLFKLI